MRAALLLLGLIISACTVDLGVEDSGAFSCVGDEMCLDDFRCIQGRCLSPCFSPRDCTGDERCLAVPGENFAACQPQAMECLAEGASCSGDDACCSRRCVDDRCALEEPDLCEEITCDPPLVCVEGSCVDENDVCRALGEDCSDGARCCSGGCDGACCVEEDVTITTCGGAQYQCGDGVDNDGDGLIDAEDGGCSGACDDDEVSILPSIPGAGSTCFRQDCFWDADSSSGNDGCSRDGGCDALDPQECGEPRECPAAQEQLCLDTCLPLVPAGCDCFGCCLLEGEPRFLTGACSLDDVDACPPCTLDESCTVPCEADSNECALCFGMTVADLSATCGGQPEQECDTRTTCVTHSDCADLAPEGKVQCITGCCRVVF